MFRCIMNKSPEHRTGFRKAEADNQVFFIDNSTGVLCSKLAGHAIDVEGSCQAEPWKILTEGVL
jgi:hypothetical protein